jgi:hypothetical protein
MARRAKGPLAPHPAERDEAEWRARRERSDDADAFFPDPGDGPARVSDDLAELLALDFVTSATTGEDAAGDDFEQEVPEEIGGPFLESDADQEFDRRPDGSNPLDGTREPLPTALGRGTYTPEELELGGTPEELELGGEGPEEGERESAAESESAGERESAAEGKSAGERESAAEGKSAGERESGAEGKSAGERESAAESESAGERESAAEGKSAGEAEIAREGGAGRKSGEKK